MCPDVSGGAVEPKQGPTAPGGFGEPPRKGLTRRAVLRTAAVAGVAVGVAGAAYWAGFDGASSRSLSATPTGTLPPSPQPSSQPSPEPSPVPAEHFQSRPDLWSPLVSIASAATDLGTGLLLLTPRGGPGPLIVDNAGSPVWIRVVANRQVLNLRRATYRGSPVLTWWEGAITRGTGQGEYVIVDGSYREVARVQAANGLTGDLHEFIVTPQGTALFSVYADHEVPAAFAGTLPTPPLSPAPSASTLPALYESIIQEVDIATGRLLFEWHSADHVGPDESYAEAPNDQSFDYFHLNSIDIEPDGNLLISARHTCALYKIDRTTGAVIWRLGGKRSDFTMGPGAAFYWQHDARRQPDGTITIFDDGSNGKNPPTEDHSRGIRLAVSETAMTADLAVAYSDPPILAKSQGSMQPLDNGDVLVGWGDQPYFTEFRADGTIAMDGRLPDAAPSYRALRFDFPGQGDGGPTVAAAPLGDGSSMVHASWNGATDVAEWEVLAGDSAGALNAVASQPRAGFETAIPILGRPAYVAVRAIDDGGRTLGDSAAIQLGRASPSP